ncbi:MAG TPA: hypothetical protein VMU88_07135 [bacterium]|nr:hypothetical protein [bacterium]
MRNPTIHRILFLALLAAPAVLFAEPPFNTGDPEPTDPGHFEIYLSGSLESGAEGLEGELPELEVDFGALPDLQLHVAAPFLYDSPQAGGAVYGYGDTELGVKLRFGNDKARDFQWGTYPLVEVPTGDAAKGLGGGQTKLFIPLWFQKELGSWKSYGGGGYWVNPGAGNLDWIYLGWVLQDSVTPFLDLGGELFFHTADEAGKSNALGWNVGGGLNFDDNHHFLMTLGRDIQENEVLYTLYAAYELDL